MSTETIIMYESICNILVNAKKKLQNVLEFLSKFSWLGTDENVSLKQQLDTTEDAWPYSRKMKKLVWFFDAEVMSASF